MFRPIFFLLFIIAISGNDSFLRIKCRRQPGQRLSGPCRRFLSPSTTTTTTIQATTTTNFTQVPTTQGTADQKPALASWLTPLLIILCGGGYGGGVVYLRLKFNFGLRHSLALGLTVFCVRAENRFDPEAPSHPRVIKKEIEMDEVVIS